MNRPTCKECGEKLGIAPRLDGMFMLHCGKVQTDSLFWEKWARLMPADRERLEKRYPEMTEEK